MRATAVILVVIVLVILGGATPESGVTQPYATDTPLAPSGFRGIDPPVTPHPGVPRGEPTPTLTPTPSSDSPNNPGTRSETVHIIASGDVASLEDAIDESNLTPTVFYEIYLLAGEYQLSATLVVIGNLKIYGAGVDTTILRQIGVPGSQPGSMNTIIKVAGSATLSIDNLTLTGGRSDGLAGAVKIETHSGTLIASNIKFIDNSAADDGGAIYSIGSMSLYKVEFRDNVAKRGGAIFHELNPNPVGIDANYVDFKNNQATNQSMGGGAVHVKTGSHKFRQSNFRNNVNNAAPTSISRQVRTQGGDIVNAKKNYWNNPTVPSSANDYGVNTLEQLASKVDIEFDSPQVPPPCGARGRQQCGPTPTATPTATATPDPIAELSAYGISIVSSDLPAPQWTYTELLEIRNSVVSIGNAFTLMNSNLTPIDNFREIMEVNDYGNISFKRTDDPFCVYLLAIRQVQCGNLVVHQEGT